MILELSHSKGNPIIKLIGSCTTQDIATILYLLINGEYSTLFVDQINNLCTKEQIQKIQKIVLAELIKENSNNVANHAVNTLEMASKSIVSPIFDNRKNNES